MSHFHLQRPPPKLPWWQKIWEIFKNAFPGRSSEQAKSFLLTFILFFGFLILTRIFFAWRGVPI